MFSLRMMLLAALVLAGFVVMVRPLAVLASPRATERARKFVETYTAKMRPLEVKSSLAWWKANTTGKDEDYEKKKEAQNRIDEVLANKKAFEEVKEIKEAGKIDDP